MSDVDFIVVSHNQLEFTQTCFESIVRHVDVPYHLIWVDNNSTDGTQDYLKEQKAKYESSRAQITLILHPGNSGYAEGLNLGIPHSHSPYVFFCNNDIEFFPGAVQETIRIAEKNPKFGLVNPNSNEFGLGRYEANFLETKKGQWIERCHTSGFCVLVKRKVVNAIGGIDPLFGPAYFEDMDYAERAKKAGFLCVTAQGAYVHHFGTRTFLPKEKQSLWDKHKEHFRERWGGTKWLAYIGDDKMIENPTERDNIRQALLELARREIAIIYLFVSARAAKYFEGIHDSFRIIASAPLIQPLFVLIRLQRSIKTKPISTIYVSGNSQLRFWKQFRGWHQANLALLRNEVTASA